MTPLTLFIDRLSTVPALMLLPGSLISGIYALHSTYIRTNPWKKYYSTTLS
jgi:hypothetical protein